MKYCLALLSLALSQTAPAVNELQSPFEVAQNDPALSDLQKIYKMTEMKFKIDQSRDVTVFMPTNDAIRQKPLKEFSYPDLVRILNYHNLGRVVDLDTLPVGDHEFETIEGAFITVTVGQKKKITINHEANVLRPKIETPMGVAYVIDKVLEPPALDDVSTHLIDLSTDLAEFSDNIGVPPHIKAINTEQQQRNDVSGLVAATAQNVATDEAKEFESAEVGVISPGKSRNNRGESARKNREPKPARMRAMEEAKIRVDKGREGRHHSGGPDLAFRERGKLY